MDVIEYAPGSLKEVIGLLQEKELRLRFPLEELDVLLEPEPDIDADNEVREVPMQVEEEEKLSDNSSDDSSDDFSEEFEQDNLAENQL